MHVEEQTRTTRLLRGPSDLYARASDKFGRLRLRVCVWRRLVEARNSQRIRFSRWHRTDHALKRPDTDLQHENGHPAMLLLHTKAGTVRVNTSRKSTMAERATLLVTSNPPITCYRSVHACSESGDSY